MEIVDEEEIPQLVEINSLKRIPVTILTGFLGSGKTTMLNHLLSVNHGKRIAVIENEFSEGLGIEKMIARNGIDGKNLDSFFELNNGCICCSIKDSLLQTLEQLVLHKDRFDYIVIETTGVANPGPIISIFWADDGVDSVLFLDGVVCTVDCINFASCMNSSVGNDMRLQVSYADRILLNKTDLVDASTVAQIEVDLRRMNQLAELKTTVYSRVSPDWVLGINSYSNGRLTSATAPFNGQFESIVCSPCIPAGEFRIETPWSSFSNQTHSAQLLTTEGLQFPGKLSVAKLSSFLDQLLYGNENFGRHSGSQNMDSTIAQERLMRVYRMKGLLHISKSNKLFLLQGVHDLFDIQPSTFDEGGPFDQSQGLNKIIVIGRSIDREFLYDKFLQCVDSVES